MTVDPQKLYTILFHHFSKQQWWPYDQQYHSINNSDPRFEIIVGAILTQNTAWSNVEKALVNMKNNKSVTINSIVDISLDHLKELIQPSGFFNQKATRLKIIANHFHNKYESDLDSFFAGDTQEIREELLSLHGIGPETADSILLYAGNKPVFVVDAYTKRICNRIPLSIPDDSYHKIQQYFESILLKNHEPHDIVEIYKQFHALLVELAKQYCKTKPHCAHCPVNNECKAALL